METIINVNYEGKPCYNIYLEEDYRGIKTVCESLDIKGRKVCIVSDSNVSALYLEEVKKNFESEVKSVTTYVFPAGEESKNLETVNSLYEQLILDKFDRKDILVALGGGVVGDLTGFTAATYLRGIRFIQLPTSLLSMVDSSIGGKTGVDYKAYKNMIGAFHQPSAVYMNLSVLCTLGEKQYFSGMGEIIKHGLIRDKNYYDWLKKNAKDICNRQMSALKPMISTSLNIKRVVVENDPKEAGERALLNFGHTLGHAIEKLMNFSMLHGDCVALGCIAASYISSQRGYITKEQFIDVVKTFELFHMPTTVMKLPIDTVIETTKSDKKMDSNQIKFILLEQIGSAYIDLKVTNEEMQQALMEIMN